MGFTPELTPAVVSMQAEAWLRRIVNLSLDDVRGCEADFETA